jgi:hypothetical protein
MLSPSWILLLAKVNVKFVPNGKDDPNDSEVNVSISPEA